MLGYEIRTARPSDAEALTRLYNHYVVNTHVTFDVEPVTVIARLEWLNGFDETGPFRIYVAADHDAVLAYACSTRLRPKPAYSSSVETTVYVDPDHTRKGIGRRLYSHLLAALEGEADLHRAYAGIALPNPGSEHLHRKLGFTHAGTFKECGRKFGRYWDVAWYEHPLDPTRERDR